MVLLVVEIVLKVWREAERVLGAEAITMAWHGARMVLTAWWVSEIVETEIIFTVNFWACIFLILWMVSPGSKMDLMIWWIAEIVLKELVLTVLLGAEMVLIVLTVWMMFWLFGASLCDTAKLVWRDIKKQNIISDLDTMLNNKRLICTATMNSQMHRYYCSFVLLKAFLMDPPKEFVKDGNLELLIPLAIEAMDFLIFDFDIYMVDRDRDMDLNHIDFFARLADIKSKAKMYLAEPIPLEIFPMIGQLEFFDHLVKNLEELVIAKADSIAPFKFFICNYAEELQYLSSYLMVMSQEHKEQPYLKHLLNKIRDSAYVVEWITDSFMVRKLPTWHYLSLLIDELQRINICESQLRTELGDVQNSENNFVEYSSNGFSLVITPIDKIHLQQIKRMLETLHDRKVHSWCVCSSYRERKKEVFLQLLQNASIPESGEPYDHNIIYTSDMSQDELETSVCEVLINKPSSIILEDVEDIDTVHDIIRVLAKPGYCGVIILETRSPELAEQCVYPLRKFLWSKYSQVGTSKSATNLRSTYSNGDDVVGFKEEMGTMLELLIEGPTKLHRISIVGMGGIGKTTLAKKLYNDRSVIGRFDIRAWCYVSHVYVTKQLLLELLRHIVQLSDTIRHMDEGELADLLRKRLLGTRYLIVLDDMWNIEAWNDLKGCFPDGNKSRIIFTTRLKELASISGSIQQSLGYLSENESWELLRMKLFEKESCPDELLEVGTQITKKCKGLPLSIVLVAGVLAKQEKTKDRWTQILKSLTSCILGAANEHGTGIIEMSYKELPDYMKPCFLYFGHFLRDREVAVSKVIRMLIAEGLIRHSKLKSLENVAEGCLMDLIGRSLVMVSQEKSNGGVKSCRVHDLIHGFCVRKAKEEEFLEQIHGYNQHFPSSDSFQDYGMDPNYIYSSAPIIYNQRHICINSKRNHFIMLKPSGPQVRSLSFLPASDTNPNYSYDISFISHNFKILTKLDLEDINIGESFNAIMMLVHLRYLAVQGYVDCIPSSISNLWKLETFLVKGLRAEVVKVPDAICDMVKLRHVHINGSASFKLDSKRSENSSILDNLQTLSTPILTHGGDMEKILRRVKGIKKLKCISLDSSDDNTNCNKFPEMGFLSQLESLKLSYGGIGRSLCEFDLPPNLTKLTLLNFRKPWSEISLLASLNNLEVLKLLRNAFEGKTWNMEDEVFSKLKFLKLDTLDVEEWIAESDHFPTLEHLILNQCEQLEEIPSDIGDINTLKKIEVMWCKQSVAVSAREIQDEQMGYCKVVKIHVHPDVGS